MNSLPVTQAPKKKADRQCGYRGLRIFRTRMHQFALPFTILIALIPSASSCSAADSPLAVISAGVSSAEDSPFVSPEYRFLPGDYLYFTFEIAGFSVRSENEGEIRKISLTYEISAEDRERHALAPPVSGEIKTELNPEDKNWVPKKGTSFLLPSFIAAGPFQIRVAVKDLVGKTETSREIPFLVGGTNLQAVNSITVENFRFLRGENDTDALSVPAYSPGDTVYARFEIAGFRNGSGNDHHVAYGVTVFGPDGKPFIKDPQAADLEDRSFYPAQFIPGNLALKMGKNNTHGEYIVVLTVRDLLADQQYETKKVFSIE